MLTSLLTIKSPEEASLCQQDEHVKTRKLASICTNWESIFGMQETFTRELPEWEDPTKRMITGSQYEGRKNLLGMKGHGLYTFPHGVVYEGNFKDGEFDGEGKLIYPRGQVMFGTWEAGRLKRWRYQFEDGLIFDDTWNYCEDPDRRFYISQKDGLEAAGRENITNAKPPNEIPEGCYDVGDRLYNPHNKCTLSLTNEQILGIPNQAEEAWIKENCRKAWDENTGYKPDLYEMWTTGTSPTQF